MVHVVLAQHNACRQPLARLARRAERYPGPAEIGDHICDGQTCHWPGQIGNGHPGSGSRNVAGTGSALLPFWEFWAVLGQLHQLHQLFSCTCSNAWVSLGSGLYVVPHRLHTDLSSAQRQRQLLPVTASPRKAPLAAAQKSKHQPLFASADHFNPAELLVKMP